MIAAHVQPPEIKFGQSNWDRAGFSGIRRRRQYWVQYC